MNKLISSLEYVHMIKMMMDSVVVCYYLLVYSREGEQILVNYKSEENAK